MAACCQNPTLRLSQAVRVSLEGIAVIVLSSVLIVLRPNPVRPAKWCVATPSGNA